MEPSTTNTSHETATQETLPYTDAQLHSVHTVWKKYYDAKGKLIDNRGRLERVHPGINEDYHERRKAIERKIDYLESIDKTKRTPDQQQQLDLLLDEGNALSNAIEQYVDTDSIQEIDIRLASMDNVWEQLGGNSLKEAIDEAKALESNPESDEFKAADAKCTKLGNVFIQNTLLYLSDSSDEARAQFFDEDNEADDSSTEQATPDSDDKSSHLSDWGKTLQHEGLLDKDIDEVFPPAYEQAIESRIEKSYEDEDTILKELAITINELAELIKQNTAAKPRTRSPERTAPARQANRRLGETALGTTFKQEMADRLTRLNPSRIGNILSRYQKREKRPKTREQIEKIGKKSIKQMRKNRFL